MMAEKKDRKPLQIKNLADLKRHIKLGTELVAMAHQYHPDIVGLTRVVTKVQTNGFYSKIKDQPDHKWSTCNQGLGFWSPFNKAGAYHFTESTVQVLNTRKNDGSVLYEMELYDSEQNMSEQNKEVPDMNEWDRLHRQAQRYKEAYPPGTRIMLLGIELDQEGMVKARPLISASGSNAGMSLIDVTATVPLTPSDTSLMAFLLWLYWMNGCCIFLILRSTFFISGGLSLESSTTFLWAILYCPDSILGTISASFSARASIALAYMAYFSTVPFEI